MKSFEVEKDKKVYLIIKAFHYLREGIGASDLLAVDYADNMKLRLLTATECKFIDFRDDINKKALKNLKTEEKPNIEHIALSD